MARERTRRPTWFWPALALLLAVGGAAAWFQVFTTFANYDDEGYLLMSLQSFVDGKALYSETYTQYGPFYYELFGLLFALTGRPVTTDAGRLIVVVEWVAIAALLGVSVRQLTRSGLLGLSATAVALTMLTLLVGEPMHPVGLIVLLLACVTALVVYGGRGGAARRVPLDAVATGVVIAALLLTKVNVGGLACIALLSALAFSHAGSPGARRWCWAVVALAALVPLLLLSGDLAEAWVRRLLVLVWAGLAAVAIVAMREERTAGDATIDPLRWLTAFVAAAVVASLAIVVAILLLGSGLGDVVDGVLLDPMRLRDIFTIPLELPAAAVDWSLAALVLALAWAVAPRLRQAHVAGGVVRLLAGLVILVSVTASSPVTLSPGSGRLALPVLLVWLAVTGAGGESRTARERFVRYALVLLPLLGVLQVYPVAGTQVAAAALMFVPAGALLVWDGARELRATVGAPSPDHARWVALVGSAAAIALLAKFTVPLLDTLQSSARAYGDQPSLGVNGAHRVHLDPERTAAFQGLVATIRRECDVLITRPGFNSLYVWAEMSPPTGLNAGDWMFLLDDEQQQRVVDAIRSVDRLCLVQNDQALATWIGASGEADAPDRPLTRYLNDAGFRPIAAPFAEHYQLMRR